MFMEFWSFDPSLHCNNMLAFVALKAAAKTHSRRQSGLVCSLLVVSLLLSAAVEGGGEEGEWSDLSVRSPWEGVHCHVLQSVFKEYCQRKQSTCMDLQGKYRPPPLVADYMPFLQ